MMTKILKSLLLGNVILLGIGILQPNSAQGAILYDSSSNVTEGENFWYSGRFSRSRETFWAFEEQTVTLTTPLPVQEYVDFGAGMGFANNWDDLSYKGSIGEGLTVTSHMVYLANSDESSRFNLGGTLRFDTPILGAYADFRLYREQNDLFAPNATYNGPGVIASLEGIGSSLPVDMVTLVDDYTIDLNWTLRSSIDSLRIITAGPDFNFTPTDEISTTVAQVPGNPAEVPEPLTILGTMLAGGFGYMMKRQYKTT